MPAQRTRQPPPITCVPRSTVDPLLHKDVDGLLKDLKFASRRIQTAGGSFVDEMRILERLYYKNKNQHRSAPFFKRMSEIRRYGQRLVELNVWERAELLRTSFFGLTTIADINQKATKGAWSFIPDIAHVSFVLERLQSCSVLVNKMKERLSQAYHQFTLAMQSGAFIQLIVLLSAISSRMSVLLSELAQVLPLITSICDRLLALHNPEHRFRRKSSLSLDVNPDSLSNNADQAQLHFGDGNCSNSNINAAYDALPMLDIRPANALTNGIEDVERIIIPPPEKVKTGPTYGKEERHKSKKVKKEEPDEIDAIFGF